MTLGVIFLLIFTFDPPDAAARKLKAICAG
jgi:hypothetical protein